MPGNNATIAVPDINRTNFRRSMTGSPIILRRIVSWPQMSASAPE
jgi:hypothetical protein